MGKRTNFKNKAMELLSPNKTLPSPEEAAAQAEAERQQEEEDLAEYRRQEAAELERLKAQKEAAPDAGAAEAAGGRKKSSKDRFKEREARKQQALLDSLPPADEEHERTIIRAKAAEKASLDKTRTALGLVEFEIQPDGHCLYSAIADQLTILGLIPDGKNKHETTRDAAASYIEAHKADFLPFLASPGGEDAAGATNDGMMTDDEFVQYVANVRNSAEWGGEPEIQALSKHFDVPIHVVQAAPPFIVSHSPIPEQNGATSAAESKALRAARITFHQQMYGLGAHYNSLREPHTSVPEPVV